jgi:uncharacterized protein YbbC (DUF1343 family)
MKLGLEVFLENSILIRNLKKKKVALICHPASVDQKLNHSFDLIHNKIGLKSAFGPQHGIKGEKQDNMIESEDTIDTKTGIPIFSLYGEVRKPTDSMLETFDTVIFDLQDLGCRIYTFITTLIYVMEECARLKKQIIILDRPNPIGREIEGFTLVQGWESFVGAAPIPMRYGLTVGELALFYKQYLKLDINLKIIKMQNYKPTQKPNFGWPDKFSWVNPSPNASNLNMARAYPGTVLIEGTNLSEGRGTTRALEQIGDPNLDFSKILSLMKKKNTTWLKGFILRECYFEPTFHKHTNKICNGIHFHTDTPFYQPKHFKPFRVVSLLLKCIRELYPDYAIYREFQYEYVKDKLPFDVINGGPRLRNWIEDSKQTPIDLEIDLTTDEKAWKKKFKEYWIYK